MRLLILALVMISACELNAQVAIPLNREWVSKDLDYFKLSKSHAFFQFNGYYQEKGYRIYGDTLRMQDWYHSSADDFKTLQHDDFDFLIKKSKNKLILMPLSKHALQISQRSVEFKPIENTYLKKFNYQSIKFTSTTCYGECPEMTLLISGNKVQFIGGKYAIKQGNYIAYLTQDLQQNLLNILKKSSFNKSKNNRPAIIDAPHYNISITQNNMTKTVSGESLPILLRPLLDFLLSLPKALEKNFVLTN